MHITYMKRHYGSKAEEWKSLEVYDDRALYCNMYRMIIEALESLPDIPHLYVRVAMNKMMEKDCSTLTSILNVFRDR